MYMEKINWSVYDKNRFSNKNYILPVLELSFKKNTVDINDVIDFINCLLETGVIYKK